MFSKSFALLATTISLLPLVSAHGRFEKVVSGGASTTVQNPYYVQGTSAVRVMLTNSLPNAFVEPHDFTNNARFSCPDVGNKPAAEHLKVTAGSTVDIYWVGASPELLGHPGAGGLTERNPFVHAMGPIMTYLADCNGDCTTFDATNAGWTKIDHYGINMNESPSAGLREVMTNKGEVYYPRQGNGLWAAGKLIEQKSVWPVTIPSALKNGKYLIRHELSAMHSVGANQNYIGCIQIDVVNGGSTPLPAGTQAKDLYDVNGQFVKFNVYSDDPSTFKIPGPELWNPSGSNTPAPAPEPTEPEEPATPEEPETDPETPVSPPGNSPSTPSQPSGTTPSPPAESQKCRQRKRELPSPIAVSKRHRRRLSAEY